MQTIGMQDVKIITIMLLSRSLTSLLFALVLLFAQQGGALHMLGHVFAEQAQQQNKKTPHAHDCEQCTTYAQLGSALDSGFMSFDIYSSPLQAIAHNSFPLLTRHTLPVSARGPPAFQRPA